VFLDGFLSAPKEMKKAPVIRNKYMHKEDADRMRMSVQKNDMS
jgi:hypothetical protein